MRNLTNQKTLLKRKGTLRERENGKESGMVGECDGKRRCDERRISSLQKKIEY